MIIYEVNVNLEPLIYQEYCEWLKQHVKIMMKHRGFVKYILARNIQDNQITIWYHITDMQALNTYLDQHSKVMRDEGIKKFGDKFKASRRILETLDSND